MKLFTATLLSLSLFAATLPLGSQRAAAQSVQAAQSSQTISITRSNSRPSQAAPAEHFTGEVRITPVFGVKAPSRTSGGSVTFQPGARSAWHTHPFGQTLIVTAGIGRVQRWGGPVDEIRQGDVVQIPAAVKHWHGASPDAAMTHIAIQEEIDGKNVEWLEKVTDEQYSKGPASSQGPQKLQGAQGARNMNNSCYAARVW